MQLEGSPSQTPMPTDDALVESPVITDASMPQAAEPPAPPLPSGFLTPQQSLLCCYGQRIKMSQPFMPGKLFCTCIGTIVSSFANMQHDNSFQDQLQQWQPQQCQPRCHPNLSPQTLYQTPQASPGVLAGCCSRLWRGGGQRAPPLPPFVRLLSLNLNGL